MSHSLTSIEKELGGLSEKLLSQFHSSSVPVRQLLSPEELVAWAKEGLIMARFSPPSSLEAATEFFRGTPDVLNVLSISHFLEWVHGAKTLCSYSPRLAIAYLKASPATLKTLSPKLIEAWVEIGRSLYRHTTESLELAGRFFTATPEMLQVLNLVRIEQLAFFLDRLAATSPNLAEECLGAAPQVLARIGKEEQKDFLTLALTLVRTNPEESARYFIEGSEPLDRVDKKQRQAFLSLAHKIAQSNPRRAIDFFFDCSHVFAETGGSRHSRLLSWTDNLVTVSPTAAIEFLKNCPAIIARIGIDGLERWFEEGARILGQKEEAGIAYFRMETVSEEALERLLARVDLERVNRILLMYSQALTGADVQIRSTEGLKAQSSGWIPEDKPTTDGSSIFLPLSVAMYDSEDENFAWYKVAVTHQAGHIEFSTFNFSFEKKAVLFTNRRHRLSPADGAALTDIERYFNIFEDRKLAADLFAIVEDTRIDYLVKQEYAGIRSSYSRIQGESLLSRPRFIHLPLREAFLEILIRISLGDEPPHIPQILNRPFRAAIKVLRRLQSQRATVEDSAEATLRLYVIIRDVPNKVLTPEQWGVDDTGENEFVEFTMSSTRQEGEEMVPMPGDELPYQPPTEVEFRGTFKPELVQLLFKLQENPDYSELYPSPLSPETLKMLANQEIQLSGVLRGEHPSSGLYVTDLPSEGETGELASGKQSKSEDKSPSANSSRQALSDEEGESFLYNEWDFRACCYLPRWCRVVEKPLAEGNSDFFNNTLVRYSALANRIKKQFGMLAPQLHKRINRLYDGEELDLDAVIQAVVERKTGHTPSEKVYKARRKIQRDVAAIFLLDMSGSTDSAIKDADDEEYYLDWYFHHLQDLTRSRDLFTAGSDRDKQRFADMAKELAELKTRHDEWLTKGRRRVIDVAKESVVLMINAMEAIGDRYGIYGFSSYGRENVELLVIKGIDEEFSDTIERRIDSITPLRGTRMGPAIRHATSKLAACEEKTKILFLVSDGYPQDEGYGRDSNDREYALHDTRMALIETRRKDIIPFCLTVDIAGYDYLKKMAGDFDYEVVNDIESLPQRLPALYKRLTS